MKQSVYTLLDRLIDYAGLFPPARLDLRSAIRNYDRYRAGNYAWALGRFVLPATRIAEFEATAAPLLATGDPWRLSALLGLNVADDLAAIAAFNDRHAGSDHAVIDTIECKAATSDRIAAVLDHVPADLSAYVELPLDPDPQPLIAILADCGARAKVRTGGVTIDAFPASDELLRFMLRCIDAGVPFKATAGLHHPLRARYRLSYEVDSPTGAMFGFLNVFLTAAFLATGMDHDQAASLLVEGDRAALTFDDQGVTWRDQHLDLQQLARARQQVAIAFGSCSFEEPIADLKAMELV